MNESDLARIETALGISLPAVFRNVMLHFPQVLIDAAKMTDADGNEFIDSMMITPDAEYIIGATEGWRRDPDWPHDYILVGDNGCGEDYSVDVSNDRCPVYESGPHNDAMANGPVSVGQALPDEPQVEVVRAEPQSVDGSISRVDLGGRITRSIRQAQPDLLVLPPEPS